MRNALLYIMDPLCGWCYGFSPVMQALQERHSDRLDFRVVPGGMITGLRVEPVSAMAGYILQAYKRVEENTGVKFGGPYLERLREGTEISDSEPPCRALQVLRSFQPDRQVAHAHQLQRALYLDGYSWNDPETYTHLASLFDIDKQAFKARYDSEEARYDTQQDFQWVQSAGITGFPALVYQKGEQYFLIARGFQPLDAVEAVLQKVEEAEA